MSHGVRTIVRTQTGPPGKDGEVTAIQLAAHAAKDRGVHGITVDTTVGTRVFLAGHMVYGDTGRRHITERLTPAPLSGYVYLRRENAMVTLWTYNLTFAETPATSWLHLPNLVPSGFQPSLDADFVSVNRTAAGGGFGVRFLSNGDCYVYGYTGSGSGAIRVRAAWETTQDWPATLPGSPV